MNYIDQIRGFWHWHKTQAYSVNEIALYFYLLEVNNISSWKISFKRNNSQTCADLRISYPTLQRIRNKLKQSEIIYFKTTNESTNVIYTLKNIFKVINDVVNEVVDEVINEVASTKCKLKFCYPPFFEGLKSDLSLERPKKEDIRIEKKENPSVELPYPFESERFKRTWALWKLYKREGHHFYYKSPISEQTALNQLKEKAADHEAIAIVGQSMANGSKGLFELKDPKAQELRRASDVQLPRRPDKNH